MKPFTILLAEDDLVTGLFVKSVLQKAGYKVWFCMDISEAWQYYADKNPDLVLLDGNQSFNNNFSLAQKIRSVNKVIPIMFLSGKTFEEEIFHNHYSLQTKTGTKVAVNEKKLLKYMHEMLRASLHYNKAPVYNIKEMKLCSADDILILTAFYEDSVHLLHYVVN